MLCKTLQGNVPISIAIKNLGLEWLWVVGVVVRDKCRVEEMNKTKQNCSQHYHCHYFYHWNTILYSEF